MSNKYPIKFDDEQLILEAGQVADTYHKLTLDLFDEVIDRLLERGTASLADNPYIWQLEKLNQMHLLNKQNLKTIAKYSKIGEEQLRQVIEGEGFRIYKDTKQHLIDDLGEGELGDSSHVQELLSGYFNQSHGDIKNLINTTLTQAVSEVYRGIIQDSVARVVTGLSTHDKALNETVMKWQDAGFKGFVDKGGKRWKIDNYARTVIKTTAIRSYREMRTMPAEELGIDTYYYSKKATAREACAPLQHHIVTTGTAREEEGYTILSLNDHGYGTPAGCLGINCGHILTPFIPGINELPELGEDVKNVTPEQAIENANAEAKQRALERSIRNNKEKLHVAEKLGDKELIDKYKSKVRIQQGAMRDYLKQHPFLHRDYAREKYYDDPYTKAKKEMKVRKELEKLEKHRAEQKEMRERFTNAVKDGIIKTEINEQKQADHIRGTNEWYRRLETDLANGKQVEPSYLIISMDEAAKLIKRYSGTGKFLYKEDPTYIPKKEIIKHDSKIGMYIDQSTGEMFETDSFRIHYRKTGAHIVPTYGGKS
ncbi:phage minor capsid protein [Streptococcus gordonii]|uniref:Capsid protein n=1 Tax=Streptococcus gordonii TaxID=1302 RepID=A0AB35FT64_STRGN|nr:phage minor capsid protein [Streptococcus gordonii]MBZ2127350.1 capsid protein [Streptococcus gordonii]MBZ2129417.1 capsid protein [Streptococcus gordonii]